MKTNTGVHSYFILLIVICLNEPTEDTSELTLSISRDETSLEPPNGLQHIQYSATKLGTAQCSELHMLGIPNEADRPNMRPCS